MADRMDVDERGSDSMGEEAEWTPMNMRQKQPRRRATKRAVQTNPSDGEIPNRPRKRKRADPAPQSKLSSHAVVNEMRKGRDYEKRSSTKILPAAHHPSGPTKSRKKGAVRRSRKKKPSNSASTSLLIQQKTTQNVLHSNVPLTAQEKWLQKQYKVIEDILRKKKESATKRQIISDSSVLEAAMGLGGGANASSSNIILEPGQQAPSSTTTAPKQNHGLEFDGVSEAFIKPSTQFTSNQRSWTTNRGGIDAENYFDSKKGSTAPRTEADSQKRALELLKRAGDTSIGKALGAKKKQKFSIKRAVKSSKPMQAAPAPHIHAPAAVPMQSLNETGGDLNDIGGDLNDIGGDGIEAVESKPSANAGGLNSTFGNLPSFGDRQESDATTLNLQKFELARKAAEDESNAIDNEEHLENCNVYVGGLHPDVDNNMLRKFFQHCGDIRKIRLDWRKKGFGFIHYSTHEQAREAIEDMDGRLILGQPIKCRWAKNKSKEQERLMRLEKEKQALLDEQKGDDPNDPSKLNQNVVAPEELMNPQQMYHRSGPNAGNERSRGDQPRGSAIGFLGRMKTKKHSPPALEVGKVQLQAVNDNDTDKSDGDTEYW